MLTPINIARLISQATNTALRLIELAMLKMNCKMANPKVPIGISTIDRREMLNTQLSAGESNK